MIRSKLTFFIPMTPKQLTVCPFLVDQLFKQVTRDVPHGPGSDIIYSLDRAVWDEKL